ncbi:MAG: hypothetical protein KGD67_13060, partial [Candidatus Lokiarchaeota archaeon]|nr:hypothetical protein [Candidatus Lokiarchaeota archaeon]
MIKRKKLLFLLTGALVLIFVFSVSPNSNSTIYYDDPNVVAYPRSSGTLEGSENVIVINIYRDVEFNPYGVVNIIDELIFKNEDNNPIDSIYIGIPLER